MTGLVIDRDDLVVGERATRGALPGARRDWAWLGLVPFFAFLVLFLLIPAISVFSNAVRTEDGVSPLRTQARIKQGHRVRHSHQDQGASRQQVEVGRRFGLSLIATDERSAAVREGCAAQDLGHQRAARVRWRRSSPACSSG